MTGGTGARPGRETHTYSIVARDPATGELGIAVQSHFFAAGTVTPAAEAGVAAVAAQAWDGAEFGPELVALVRGGMPAGDALAALLGADPDRELRQVAVVDAAGRVAVHTGARCTAAAGHAVGDGFSVQANVMLDESVWPAMKRAYEAAAGTLAERLVASLEGGQAAGGDVRGQQSAALVVVAGARQARPWLGRLVDLRVDDHPRPVAELKRLVRLHRGHELLYGAKTALLRGVPDEALACTTAALGVAPDQMEIRFYHAMGLLEVGREREAVEAFRAVFAEQPQWARLLPRLVPRGLISRGAAALPRILAEAAGAGPGAARA